MTANPVELIGGMTTAGNVPKADFVGWAKARVPQVMADAAEVNNATMGIQLVIYVKSLTAYFVVDTADSTTLDDGATCLVSLDGKRFKIVSAIPLPTAISVGGVFSHTAVPHYFVTGVNTDGSLFTAQPAASDLSNGITGSGAVVLATAPAIAGGSHDGLTSLGIRSTGAAFDVKLASTEVLTATRTLSVVMGDANQSVSLAGNLSYGGAFTMSGAYAFTGTLTGATGVTFPTTGTLATLAGSETLTNKGINATNNTVTNLTTAMFATNVVDTDGTLTANSDTRIASQKATKLYVDTVAQGLDPKQSVLVATTANIVLSGEQTIDGTLTSASRVLVKNQTAPAENGIYVSAAGAWTRATDADTWAELPGAFVFVEQGTVNDNTGWTCTVNAGGTLGTTAVTFVQFAGAGTFTAGAGLTLTGTVFAIDSTVATLTGTQALTDKTYNGLTISSTTGTLTLAAGKTATINNTLTFSGTDASSVAFGTGGTVIYSGGAAGTPSSITLTNGTGLPVSTGISGLGTGIATALAVNVGSVGAPVVFNGAAGTPSSLTLTNATGLPTAGVVDNAITLAKMAQVATATFLGRTTAATGNVEALTTTQATALLNAMGGDSGSGGTKGLVPAPSAGDAAANKVLGAGGTWVVQSGSGGSTTSQYNHGRLTYVNATTLKFAPFNGDQLKINGALYSIPAAGITGLANTSVFVNGTGASNLAASTLYYVYAFNNSGTVTADFSTTARATSATAGNIGTEIKSADDTRSLIGMAYTNASSQFVDAQTISWFNRRNKTVSVPVTANTSVSTPGFSEFSSSFRATFVSWADETVQALAPGGLFNTAVGDTGNMAVAFDGTTPSDQGSMICNGTTAVVAGTAAGIAALSDGNHYATLVGRNTNSVATSVTGNATSGARTVLSVTIRG